MKQFLGLLSTIFLFSFASQAQVFWTEDFGDGACNQGQLATDYPSGNGAWTTTQTGVNGAIANIWFVSGEELGGLGDGNCGTVCGGDMNNTLHVGNSEVSFMGTVIFEADLGAAYFESGDATTESDTRIESPTIDCTGQSSIFINFLYLEGLNGTDADPVDDNAELWYFDGTTWVLLDDPQKTPSACAPQGTWTAYTFALPASADNNANVKIGFRWVNDGDGAATDPSFAVDDITLSTPSTNNPIALFGALPDTICATDVIALIDDQSSSDGTITTWTWDFDGGIADLTDPANPINLSWTLAQAGEHTISLTVTDEFGTSLAYTENIFIEDCTPTADFSISPVAICAGESISFTNNSVSQDDPPSATWAWTFGNGNISSDENPADETYLAVDLYNIQLIVTDDYGSDTATVQLSVIDCSVPNAFFTANDTIICEGANITFTDASISSSGATINDWQWTFPGGTPADFNGQVPSNVLYSTAGNYAASLVVTDANGVSDPFIQNITVIACVASDVVINVPDTIICIGDCLTYTDASIGENITEWDWTFEGGSTPTSSSQNPDEVCYTTAGVFNTTLSITDESGVTTESITVYVNSSPAINLTASSSIICAGQSVTLVATGGGNTPSWSDGIIDGEPFAPTLGSHTYTGTITDEITGCSNSEDITITVENCVAPTSLFGTSSNEICMGDCIDISDFSSNADTLFWDFGPDATPSSHIGLPGENIQVCFDTLGTYTISQTASNALGSDVSTTDIIVHGRPTLVINNDTYAVDFGNSVTISANSFDEVTYSWFPPQTLDNPTSQSPSATPEEETVYTVTIMDENNCTATGSVLVTVDYTIGLGIPTAFSPGAAAPNNTFGPLGYGFEVHRFIIYNRYGQKVFEAQEAGVLWDGTMDGKRLNSGTFFWTLDYEFLGETRKTTNGQVSLIH